MASIDVRVAGSGDAGALASLRALWHPGEHGDLDERMAVWLAADGDRRTTWLAMVAGEPAGMASLFEYRRMPRADAPDSRWGYVGNVFVREDARNRGIGSALLAAVIAAAEERDYAHLLLAPSADALPFFRRAGFDDAGLLRRGRMGRP
jgi:GNAT superfamily N-acetyltransferase